MYVSYCFPQLALWYSSFMQKCYNMAQGHLKGQVKNNTELTGKRNHHIFNKKCYSVSSDGKRNHKSSFLASYLVHVGNLYF